MLPESTRSDDPQPPRPASARLAGSPVLGHRRRRGSGQLRRTEPHTHSHAADPDGRHHPNHDPGRCGWSHVHPRSAHRQTRPIDRSLLRARRECRRRRFNEASRTSPCSVTGPCTARRGEVSLASVQSGLSDRVPLGARARCDVPSKGASADPASTDAPTGGGVQHLGA